MRDGSQAFTFASLLAFSAIVASSCGLSSYVYLDHVNSSGGDSYFRVPSSWKIFDQSQIFRATSAQIPISTQRKLESQSWSNIIAGSPNAKLNATSGLTAPYPFGITQQIQLTSAQSSSVTVASLRQILLPSDPLAPGANTTGFSYQVLSYREFKAAGGLQGSTMEVRIIGSNNKVSVLDQKAMLDAHKQWVYFIGVGCELSCFNAHKKTIEQIVNFWNVKER